MAEDERLHDVVRLLSRYSARPPLKFPNDAEIPAIAKQILKAIDGPRSLWKKWSAEREELANRAAEVWVPLDDLRDVLNRLPGEPLTPVDVEQRLYSLRHEDGGWRHAPDQELKDESFAAYAEEKAKGTEFIAILGWLQEWTWGEEARLQHKREEERRQRVEQNKCKAEARLRSGADCPWTIAADSPDLHCSKNGRLFRLKPLEKSESPLAPSVEVFEVKSFEDKRGVSIGRYRTRGDASKAVLEVA